MNQAKEVVQVILCTYETASRCWELAWVKRKGPCFRVADRKTGEHTWFATYAIARGIFQACCEEEGADPGELDDTIKETAIAGAAEYFERKFVDRVRKGMPS